MNDGYRPSSNHVPLNVNKTWKKVLRWTELNTPFEIKTNYDLDIISLLQVSPQKFIENMKSQTNLKTYLVF